MRVLWCVAFIGVAAVQIIMRLQGDQRLWLFTIMTWLSVPSSFVIVPVVYRVLLAFDVYNIRAMDFVVAVFVGVAGYFQWFILIPFAFRRRKATNVLAVSDDTR